MLFKFPNLTHGTVYFGETARHSFKWTFLHVFKILFKTVHVRGYNCNMFRAATNFMDKMWYIYSALDIVRYYLFEMLIEQLTKVF